MWGMQYRHLGKSGLKVSALSFGSWVTFGDQLDTSLAQECMEAAYDAGVNFFDNAEAYASGKSETIMGEVLKRTGWRREDLVVSTKIFWGGNGPNDRGLSRKHILEGARAALKRLQLEYVDLIFCHRPDPETPIEETVRALSYLVNQGHACYWGTSEWSAEQIRTAVELAYRLGLVPPSMEQPEYNMFHRERVEVEYAPLYRDCGLGTTIWSPLASGLLTGKYADGVPAGSRLALPGYTWLRQRLESAEGRANVETVSQLAPVAQDIGCSLAQLAIAWCLANEHVSTVITGASNPEQVKENMAALDVLEQLDAAMLQRIDDILGNCPGGPRNYR
jgi:voltage-dependent potassium channel beta subunit